MEGIFYPAAFGEFGESGSQGQFRCRPGIARLPVACPLFSSDRGGIICFHGDRTVSGPVYEAVQLQLPMCILDVILCFLVSQCVGNACHPPSSPACDVGTTRVIMLDIPPLVLRETLSLSHTSRTLLCFVFFGVGKQTARKQRPNKSGVGVVVLWN